MYLYVHSLLSATAKRSLHIGSVAGDNKQQKH